MAYVGGPPVETLTSGDVSKGAIDVPRAEGEKWVTLICDGDPTHTREYLVTDDGLS